MLPQLNTSVDSESRECNNIVFDIIVTGNVIVLYPWKNIFPGNLKIKILTMSRMSVRRQPCVVSGITRAIADPACRIIKFLSKRRWNGNALENVSGLIFGSEIFIKRDKTMLLKICKSRNLLITTCINRLLINGKQALFKKWIKDKKYQIKTNSGTSSFANIFKSPPQSSINYIRSRLTLLDKKRTVKNSTLVGCGGHSQFPLSQIYFFTSSEIGMPKTERSEMGVCVLIGDLV